MLAYPRLGKIMAGTTEENAEAVFHRKVVPHLVEVWLKDYERLAGESDIVETTTAGFSYLFDIAPGRLIAAWGMSRGRYGGPRDAGRMRNHPRAGGDLYHRGHAIPHRLGGPTDINLVPQLGAVNIGPFKALEQKAVDTPGSLYFTYWVYRRAKDQIPARVEQGLLIPRRIPELRAYPN